MWKILVGFAVFAAAALYIFIKAGADVHIGGEQHDVGASPSHTPAASAASAASR